MMAFKFNKKPRQLLGLFLFARQILRHEKLLNLIQACESLMRSGYGFIALCRNQSKNRHVCRYSSADADETIFDNDTISWRNSEMIRRS